MRSLAAVWLIGAAAASGQVVREEGAVLRERCEAGSKEVARLDGGAAVKLRVVVAAAALVCVAVRTDDKLEGFLDREALEELEKFEQGRRQAVNERRLGIQAKTAKPVARKAWPAAKPVSAKAPPKANPAPAPVAASPVPDFSFPSAADPGKEITRKSLAGRTCLIQFWADWCQACAAQTPALRSLYEKYRGRPFEIVTVGFGAPPADAPWLRATLDGGFSSDTARKLGVERLPATILIDREGRIVGRDVAPAEIERVLGGPR